MKVQDVIDLWHVSPSFPRTHRIASIKFEDEDLEMVTDKTEWSHIRRLLCLENSVGDFRLASDARSANFLLAPQQVFSRMRLSFLPLWFCTVLPSFLSLFLLPVPSHPLILSLSLRLYLCASC